jgi:hypothetical protein
MDTVLFLFIEWKSYKLHDLMVRGCRKVIKINKMFSVGDPNPIGSLATSLSLLFQSFNVDGDIFGFVTL